MRFGLVVYGGLDETSGGYRYDRRLVSHLRESGDEVDVITLPWRRYGRCLLHNLSPRVRRKLQGSYDVLLEDELCHPSLLRWPRGGNAPIVSIVHHLKSSETRSAPATAVVRQLERRYLAGVDGVVCPSRATRRTVADLRECPGVVAPPGRDHVPESLPPARIDERSRESPFRVAFLGNLIPRKGVHTLLRGLAGLPDEDWRLVAIGNRAIDPGYVRRLRRLAGQLGIDDAVSFPGRLPDDEVAARLAESHVLAVPSRYEGFGLCYLEGMAFGLPALATTAGGAGELITDGENGLLVNPESPAAVTEAIAPLLADRGHLRELAQAARERFAAHPTWSETGSEIRAFLREIADD